MASTLDICNMALRHLGITNMIASLTERTKEAKACSLFYPQVRDETLRDAPWPFATRFPLLAVVDDDPTAEWLYSYRYPSACITLRRLVDTISLQKITLFNSDEGVIRYPTVQIPHINYRITRDDTGLLILTSQQGPLYCEITEQVTDPTQYPPDVTQAMAMKMAGYISPSVAGNDVLKLGERAFQMYSLMIARARQNAGNEQQLDLQSYTSELERARS